MSHAVARWSGFAFVMLAACGDDTGDGGEPPASATTSTASSSSDVSSSHGATSSTASNVTTAGPGGNGGSTSDGGGGSTTSGDGGATTASTSGEGGAGTTTGTASGGGGAVTTTGTASGVGGAGGADVPEEVEPGPPELHCVAAIHGPDRQLAFGIASAPDGRIAVTGLLQGSADFGDGDPITSAGSGDAFIAIYSSECELLHKARFGGAQAEVLLDAAFDASGALYVTIDNRSTVDIGLGAHTTNATEPRIVLARFDEHFVPTWSMQSVGSGHHAGLGLDVDDAGNVYVGGGFNGTMALGTGAPSLTGVEPGFGTTPFFVKLDASGAHELSRAFSVSQDGSVLVRYVDVAPNGERVVVSGVVPGGTTIDLGGGEISSPSTPPSSFYPFVAAFSGDGDHAWSRALPTRGDTGLALAADDGDVLWTALLDPDLSVDLGAGPISGTAAFVRFDADTGSTNWSRAFETGFFQPTLSATAPGGALFAGTFSGNELDLGGGPLEYYLPPGGDTSPPSGDLYLARFDASGQHLYSLSFPSPGAQYWANAAALPSGGTAFAGSYCNELTLEDEVLSNDDLATEDAFVAVFSK